MWTKWSEIQSHNFLDRNDGSDFVLIPSKIYYITILTQKMSIFLENCIKVNINNKENEINVLPLQNLIKITKRYFLNKITFEISHSINFPSTSKSFHLLKKIFLWLLLLTFKDFTTKKCTRAKFKKGGWKLIWKFRTK